MDANGLISTDEIADWFDAVLDESWTRQYDRGYNHDETWFLMGNALNPQVRIKISDGEINIVEYSENGLIEAETRMHGDAQRQCPRALTLLGIA